MKALKFILSGKTAFFKVPMVNSVCYFTYGNIHKPALLGMFGAILGYKGYGYEITNFPEYYEKLKDVKISIVPNSENGYFNKKFQQFNNSVGYASQEHLIYNLQELKKYKLKLMKLNSKICICKSITYSEDQYVNRMIR